MAGLRRCTKRPPTEAALRLLEPTQGLAGVAPEQSIVLAVAGIQYGQRRRDVPACAASLLLLCGLALLAGLSAFRRLVHRMRPSWLCDALSYKVHIRS
jgi:hypothetical protein